MAVADIIDIPEGRTNDYLIHGVFAIIAAGILLLAHWSLTVLMTALAISLFLVSSGVQIDVEGRRARVYKAIGSLRFGTWVGMERYKSVSLRFTNESQVLTSRASQTNVRVRTFDLHLTTSSGEPILFHDFTDYTKARKCAETMAKQWSWNLTDEIQERRQHAQANAQNRRR